MSADSETNTQQTSQTLGTSELTARRRAKPPAEGQGVRLTEQAAAQLKEILQKGNYPDTMYLYVGVKGGGCSGFQTVLDLRDEVHVPVAETDEVFESHGVIIVCDKKSYIVGNLGGSTVDYQDGLMGAGFRLNNPNAKQQCGCGASYLA